MHRRNFLFVLFLTAVMPSTWLIKDKQSVRVVEGWILKEEDI